jgi:RNA recognition motif-containing protein
MANKLYIGNFPWSTTEGELQELFAQYGELKSVKLIMDRETGRSRGFAFIEFVDAGAAQEAMDNENERDMGGRALKVREAVDKAREPRSDTRPQCDSRPTQPQQPQQLPPDRSNGNAKRSRENRPSRRDNDR